MAQFLQANVLGTVFETTPRYMQLQPVGIGSPGVICSAYDQICQQAVAVKKVVQPFNSAALAKRTHREIALLNRVRHGNLVSSNDIFISPREDIYIVTELMMTDLSRILKSKPLENAFAQFLVYQLLRGLKYLHSAGVIHRNLKPSNILINENCDLKICDFGLARERGYQVTGYVATEYYRAPEIMMTWQKYDEAVDIWSAGCIFAEMIMGRPLFPGKDHVHQFHIMTELLGNPSEATLERIGNRDDALLHPYVACYHDPTDEPVASEKFDWSFTARDLEQDAWKMMIYSEVRRYHRTNMSENLSARVMDWNSAVIDGSSAVSVNSLWKPVIVV
ncbi:MAPK protein hog1 [Aspergillus hancockii]|nr:MAPK protein hog1 [Aspergillus hancockii]